MVSPPLSLDCWSELPLDLMQLIFERLSFVDFERAKLVCSSWLSGSRQSKPNNKIPWMILLPEEKNYCLLFNPEDKEEKLYKTQHLDKYLADSLCLATCRSWLLISTYGHRAGHLYILNLLTRERINLLPTTLDQDFDSPILWIDDKTKDYLVIGEDLVYFKKGDHSWNKSIREQLSCIQDVVFKDHKLYCLTVDELCIFDFSGEFPLQVYRVSVGGYVKLEISGRMRSPEPWEFNHLRRRNNVVVTLRGEVLIVRSKNPWMSWSWNFRIFKMDSSNGKIKWEEIFSLGDEAIILDLGITVLAKDQEGVTSNSIYFTGGEINWYHTEIFVFNLDTKKVEQLPQLVSSSVSFSRARWFLPSFRND